MSEDAIMNLQRRVAALEARRDSRAFDEHALKSQAAAAQATEHLYALLRSDTKPLLDMAAFVRKVASINPDHVAYSMYHAVRELVEEAQDILKRST